MSQEFELASSFADLEREAAKLLSSVKMDTKMWDSSIPFRRGGDVDDRRTNSTPSSAGSERIRSPDSDGRQGGSFTPPRGMSNGDTSQGRGTHEFNSSSSTRRSSGGSSMDQQRGQQHTTATVVPERETKRALKKLANHWGRFANSFGYCALCGKEIIGADNGCEALGKVYHSSCFTCTHCDESLTGQTFFIVKDKIFCERDYLKTLEKCYKCKQTVTDKIIRAMGESFHTSCFVCSVCGLCLDGVPFTVDAKNNVYCIKDFNYTYAPKCGVCDQPIVQDDDAKDNIRVVAMDKSFHPRCYKCEDCGKNLTEQGEGCYPLDNHLLCRDCNSDRIQSLTSTLL